MCSTPLSRYASACVNRRPCGDVITIATGAVVWFRSGRLLGMLSKRLAELESAINACAKSAYQAPSNLLTFETDMRTKRRMVLRELMS